MTLILETPQSDIHLCPSCGAHCAVERDVLMNARNAGQRVKIACHKCDEIFPPVDERKETDKTDVAVPARTESQVRLAMEAPAVEASAVEAPAIGTPAVEASVRRQDSGRHRRETREQTQPRLGTCSHCGGRFSLPPLTNFGDVIVECPHCTAEMMPEAVGRLNARAEVVSAAASRMAELHAPQRHSGLRIMLVLMLIGLGLVTAFAGGAFFEMTPRPADSAVLSAAPAPRIAVTNTSFRTFSADGAILVTVALTNLGTASGAPEKVTVELVDANGTQLASRPGASRELGLAPGETRELVTRMPAPAGLVDQIRVNLKQARTE